MIKMKKSEKGFTLIEIIAVIIIIGILALVTVPAVTRYVNSSRNKTYDAYEENMEVAANNRVTTCVSENSSDCNLPGKGEKTVFYLHDLVENGYIDELKDPETDGFCDNMLSYVEVSNTGSANYEYNACLYCGNYATEGGVCQEYEEDAEKPTCGEVTGESKKWTNQNRTITVKCSDTSTGCTSGEFSKTFRDTTTTDIITIADKSGNINECPVDVYIDKVKPTCTLKVISGKEESAGWYSGDVKVQLSNPQDADSGVLTYGIGTSLNERNYNKGTEITLKQGLTTVIGYVKDYAGNEGVCTLDVKVGAPQPQFDVEYGYQIYPNKEAYSLMNMTESGTTLTATTNDPAISFSGLGKYKQVNRIVVHLNSAITKTNEQAQVFYSNGSHSEEQSQTIILPTGATKFEIAIPQGTYTNIRLDIGETSGDAYNISKIELMVGDRSSLYTNKDVSINLRPKNEVVRTTEYSFDDGATYQASGTKTFTSNYSSNARTKNIATLISEPTAISIQNIDKNNPTVTLVAKKKTSGTTVSSGTWSNEGLNFVLTSGNVGISGATIYYCKDTTNTCEPNLTTTTGTTITAYNTTVATYYIRYKIVSGAGTSSTVASYTAKVDLTSPTITSVTGNPTTWVKSDVTLTVNGATDNSDGIGLHDTPYSFDGGSTWQASNTKTYSGNASSINIKVRDKVGNTYDYSSSTGTTISISKIDKSVPTCTFSIEGTHTAKVTCTDTGGSGIVNSGTSWTLSNGADRTQSYTTSDGAGNTSTVSHTYKYSSCRTGANTCSYGCDSCYDSCASTTTKCTTSCGSAPSGCDGCDSACDTDCNGTPVSCGTSTSCSDVCRGGYVDCHCSSCYYGSNTCAGGFYLN